MVITLRGHHKWVICWSFPTCAMVRLCSSGSSATSSIVTPTLSLTSYWMGSAVIFFCWLHDTNTYERRVIWTSAQQCEVCAASQAECCEKEGGHNSTISAEFRHFVMGFYILKHWAAEKRICTISAEFRHNHIVAEMIMNESCSGILSTQHDTNTWGTWSIGSQV